MAAPAGIRAEKTRQAILDAAESLFAECGFSATRLEDIAASVGIRRASMVYHFKDKRALHEAVLMDVLDGLHQAERDATEAVEDPEARVEAAVVAWVDYVAGRPSTARIILRELADSGRELTPQVLEAARPLSLWVRRTFVENEEMQAAVRATGRPEIDRAHIASTIVGATIFYVAAVPLIQTGSELWPLAPDQVEIHKAELVRVIRQLLGFDAERS